MCIQLFSLGKFRRHNIEADRQFASFDSFQFLYWTDDALFKPQMKEKCDKFVSFYILGAMKCCEGVESWR